jgi:hypothetical protein
VFQDHVLEAPLRLFGRRAKGGRACGHCGAPLYLEGCLEDVTLATTLARQANSERSAVAVIQTTKDLKRLKIAG